MNSTSLSKIGLQALKAMIARLVNVACVFLHSDAARYPSTERPPKLGRDKFRKCVWTRHNRHAVALLSSRSYLQSNFHIATTGTLFVTYFV